MELSELQPNLMEHGCYMLVIVRLGLIFTKACSFLYNLLSLDEEKELPFRSIMELDCIAKDTILMV